MQDYSYLAHYIGKKLSVSESSSRITAKSSNFAIVIGHKSVSGVERKTALRIEMRRPRQFFQRQGCQEILTSWRSLRHV